jgi:hypothetical protein
VTAVHFFQLLVLFLLSFLATSVSIVHIPESLADMQDPPNLYG